MNDQHQFVKPVIRYAVIRYAGLILCWDYHQVTWALPLTSGVIQLTK